jgi:K+/H+ antiporter YhaU regulatory subunit KhtT
MAMAARDEVEAEELGAAGADLVFRPFQDAAEYAADAVTGAAQLFPAAVDWPLAFHEVRLKPGSVFAGRTIGEIPLRAETGVSILALSRAGKVHFDVGPDFRIYPGDHLMLMGTPAGVKHAEEYLEQKIPYTAAKKADTFALAEVEIAPGSPRIGRTLAELSFRQNFEVTVVGIQRGQERIFTPTASERLQPADRLVVVGSRAAIENLRAKAPL